MRVRDSRGLCRLDAFERRPPPLAALLNGRILWRFPTGGDTKDTAKRYGQSTRWSSSVFNLPPRFHFPREDLLVDSVCVPRLCFGQRTHHPFGASRVVFILLRGKRYPDDDRGVKDRPFLDPSACSRGLPLPPFWVNLASDRGVRSGELIVTIRQLW
jgi:hypothetical protein